MSDSEQPGFIARAAALRQSTPRAEDLIPLPDVAAAIAVALRLTACQAGLILVDDLKEGRASDIALFRGYYGGRISPISADRMPAQPGDFNDSRTHWPSERDNELRDLPLALIMGFALGDQLGGLMLRRTDAARYFLDPLLEHLPVTTATSPAAVVPAPLVNPAPAAPSAPESKAEERRRAVKMLRDLKARNAKGASKEVAAAFGVHERTVREWRAIAKKDEAATKKEGALGSQFQSLAGTRTGN